MDETLDSIIKAYERNDIGTAFHLALAYIGYLKRQKDDLNTQVKLLLELR